MCNVFVVRLTLLAPQPLTSSELQQEDCVKLKLSIAWIGGAPQDRILFVESSARRNREMRSSMLSVERGGADRGGGRD